MKKSNNFSFSWLFIGLLALVLAIPVSCFAQVPSVTENFAARTCTPLAMLVEEGTRRFLLRDAFETIRDVCVEVADQVWNAFSLVLQSVVILGIGIYVAVYTLKNIGSFSQQDIAAYLTGSKGGVIPLAFKGACIVLCLQHQDFVYQYLVAPIIITGAEIGGGDVPAFEDVGSVGGLFNFVINKSEEFNREAYQLVAVGRLLTCLAFLPLSIIDWYWTLIPYGITLYVFGWMIIIGMAFYMLDMIFRLGVACILLPFALACAVSKLSIYYTKQTWNLFINIAFNFIMLDLIIKFTLEMIKESLKALIAANLVAMLAGQFSDALVEYIVESLKTGTFVQITLTCIISFKLFMKIDTIVDSVAQSGVAGKMNAGQKVAGAALKGAKGAAMQPVKYAGRLAVAGGKAIGDTQVMQATGRGLRTPFIAMRRGWRNTRGWVKRNVFRLND